MWQRWNTSTHIFEKSDDDGAIWVPLPLSAAIITEGSLADARLSSNVALKDAANVFTANQLISKTRPELQTLHSGTAKTRLASYAANATYVTTNIAFDGTNWNLDDTSLDGVFAALYAGKVEIYRASAGSNPRTPVLQSVMDNGLYTVFSIDLTGGSLKFPATQSSSSNANTLDDYEWGSWTPALLGSGGQSGQVYSTQSGVYVKIGRFTFISGEITLTTLGTLTGTVLLGGFPFTTTTTAGGRGALSVGYWANMGANITHFNGYIEGNTTYSVLRTNKGVAASGLTMVQADFSATTQFLFSGCYRSTT